MGGGWGLLGRKEKKKESESQVTGFVLWLVVVGGCRRVSDRDITTVTVILVCGAAEPRMMRIGRL